MQTYPWHEEVAAHLRALRPQLPHALLLHGAKGLGKRALAQDFVKLLLCERGQAAACGECAACRWLAAGNHPDLMVVEAEPPEDDEDSNGDARKRVGITVAQIRAVRDFLQTGAHRAGLRIVTIHPAEGMNAAAANALLKTLEEPPPGALLVLVSHQPARLPATIRSRCQSVRFNLPDAAVAERWLAGQGVAEAGLCLRLAGGAPLLAVDMADSAWQTGRREWLTELSRPDVSAVTLAERYARWDNNSFVRWLTSVQQWAQDLLSLRMTGRIGYHTDFARALESLSRRTKVDALLRFQQRLLRARQSAGHPLNLQMVIEDIVIDYNELFLKDKTR